MRKSIEALFSKSRADLLSTLVLQPEREWFLSDIAKHLKVSPSSLQREVVRLNKAEIITRRADGNRVYYQANPDCSFLPELQGLFIKTAGLVDILADALRPLRKRISAAIIFGSIARGEELSKSDIDLLVIGSLGLSDLTPALKKVEAKLSREVQPFVFSPEEFKERYHSNDHFVRSIVSAPVLSVVGNLNGYVEATGM